jgi:small conductance mechanosensitive channel
MTQQLIDFANFYLLPLFWKLLGAVVVWIVGGWLIKILSGMLSRTLKQRKVDATLCRYLEAGAAIGLRLLVVIAVLGVLGIETTSFAALLAAIGIAIGAAWGGLLSNFAAGIFLIVLRPFKVGDMISAGGVTGDVKELGLFVTTLDTPDNIRVYVGNNKIFSDNIQNYSTNPYRRVDLKAQMAHEVNLPDAIQRLKMRIGQIPNVVSQPAPDVEILEFNPAGAILAVRPYCANEHYWQVYFDTNKAITEVSTEAKHPIPARHLLMRQS